MPHRQASEQRHPTRGSRPGPLTVTAIAGCITIACLTTGGCSQGTQPPTPTNAANSPGTTRPADTTTADTTADAAAILRRRPSYEAASAQYLALLSELRAALSQVTPSLTWMTPAPALGGNTFCDQPFTKIPDTQRSSYHSGNAKGAIPDRDWPRAVEAIKRVAGPRGFTTTSLAIDRPSDHSLAIKDDLGAVLHFGTAKNTTLYLSGACFIQQNPDAGTTTP